MPRTLISRLQAYRLEAGFFLALVALLALTAWLFMPGTSGPFILDDYSNLSPLGEYGGVVNFETFRQFVFSNLSGPTGRPISMISFLLDAQDWPAEPDRFKYTNIMIHLLCGLAFCWLAFLLAERMGLNRKGSCQVALVVTMLWLVHPLNVSTTLYVVQRMAQLMTLFATLSLVFYMLGRRAMENQRSHANLLLVLSLFPFGLLAVLSKENGALLLLLIVIIEFLFFRDHIRSRFFRFWFRFAVIFPLCIVLAYLVYAVPGFVERYEFRSYTMIERLLTEARILSTYIWKIFLPDQYLGSVFHDAYPPSTGLFSPLTTFICVLFLGGLLATAIWVRKRQPVFSFAVFWFFTMHLIESTVLPLELYFEHRNYMPMFGPLFAVGWYLHALMVSAVNNSAKFVGGAFVFGNFLLSSGLTFSVINVWGDADEFYTYMTRQSPESVRARLVYAESLELQGQLDAALEQLYIMREYHPDQLMVLANLWNFACQYRLEQPMSLDEIARVPDLKVTVGNINFMLSKIENSLRSGYCPRPEREALLAFYDRIAELPMRARRKSLMYFNYSNIHLLLGEPEAALEKLEIAMEHQPSITLRLRQAVIAGSIADFERALEYTSLARELIPEGFSLVPKRHDQIDRLEAIIREQMARRSRN